MKKYTAILLLLLTGCEPVTPQPDHDLIQAKKRECMLVFLLDTSGSFTDKMFGEDAVAYNFFLRASDKLFRDRMGTHDRILIAQLSANNRTLLWEGSPLGLRRKFRDAKALEEFIREKSNPCGSRLYAGVADTLDYLCKLPARNDTETRQCVLVLSDMMDNSDTQDEDRQRMVRTLDRFNQTDSAIGFYWVDQWCLSDCWQCLSDAGIDNAIVEAGFVDDPELPSFQDP